MREKLKKYSLSPEHSCLLMGQRGLDLITDAKELASVILKTTVERLPVHPDFMLVDTDKEKSIGVDAVSEVIAKASLVPALSDKIVVLINNFDKVTEQAQNMLLKLIEEDAHVLIIGTCYQDNILDTIKSRCSLFWYKPYAKDEFVKYCEEKHIENASLLYYLTNGCPLLIEDEPELLDVFLTVDETLKKGEYLQLLENLHLQEEKDKDNFFVKYPYHVKSLLGFLLSHFQTKWIENPQGNYKNICNKIGKNIIDCSKNTYSKDNFFYLVANIITGGIKDVK